MHRPQYEKSHKFDVIKKKNLVFNKSKHNKMKKQVTDLKIFIAHRLTKG